MSDWYITSILQEEATPFVLSHMLRIGCVYDSEWAQESLPHIRWYGAHCSKGTQGVLGIMVCDAMPDDLIIVGLYGNAKAVKILGEFVIGFKQPNKFGYVDINNETWIRALSKRGFWFSDEVEQDRMGNKIVLVNIGAA